MRPSGKNGFEDNVVLKTFSGIKDKNVFSKINK